MNKEDECSLITDIFPLYVEKLTSTKTNKIIKEHLQECEECSNTLKNLTKTTLDVESQQQKREFDYLKKYKKKMSNLKIFLIIFVVIAFWITLMSIDSYKVLTSGGNEEENLVITLGSADNDTFYGLGYSIQYIPTASDPEYMVDLQILYYVDIPLIGDGDH